MRRRRQGDPKASSASDTEYFSDSGCYTVEQPASAAGDALSSHSDQYASEVYSASDDEKSDSPVASGSTLPPRSPSATQVSGEFKVPTEADQPETLNERAWYEFDLSVVLAMLSPLANWLTGSDYVKNILLILLLVFYLHQIIEVPWSLYLAARPRRAPGTLLHDSAADKYHRAALSELHALEIFYLCLSVLSPFLGATLLRTVLVSFSGPSTVSWFSLSLFMLATGVRPWRHVIRRLRRRTTDLHTLIHYPPPQTQKMQALMDRVTHLEAELKSVRKQSKSLNSDVYEHVEDAIEIMEIATRRQDKKAEVSKAFMEGRMMKLEQNVETLLERMEIRADRPVLYQIMDQISTSVSALVELLSPFLPAWVLVRVRSNASRSPRSSPKMGRCRASIKLETIPEVSTFQPKSSVKYSRHFHLPGLGLALRISDLATLPLRCVVAYFLEGRIYTPRTRAPVS